MRHYMRRFFLEMKIIYIYYPQKKSTFHSKYLWEIDKQLNKSSHKNFSMWKVIIKWMFKANLNRSAILLEWSQFIQFFLAVFFRFRVSVQRSSRTLFLAVFFRFRVSIQRFLRTPLCHFDKLEEQREQPGDSANLSL